MVEGWEREGQERDGNRSAARRRGGYQGVPAASSLLQVSTLDTLALMA